MRPSAVLLDLDGTLVDSAPGIEAVCGQALADVRPDLALPPLRPFIGPPIGRVLQAALPDLPAADVEAAVARFRVRYDADGWRTAAPFPGAGDVLAGLAARGVAAFVVTNKPAAPTAAILAGQGWDVHVRAAYSPDSATPRHASKAAAIAALLADHGLDPTTAWFVGDAEDDRAAARAHGMRFVPALYGYGRLAPGPDEPLALHALSDLLAAIPLPEEPR